jgi:hypothetical protein
MGHPAGPDEKQVPSVSLRMTGLTVGKGEKQMTDRFLPKMFHNEKEGGRICAAL